MHLLRSFTKAQIAIFAAALFISFGIAYAVTTRDKDVVNALQAPCKDTCVALTENGASPNSIAIATGSYVQFNSADGKSHNLSIGEGGHEHEHTGKFYSGEFQADEAWRVQFNDEGTFKFHDHFNPNINVIVVVYTPGKEYRVE